MPVDPRFGADSVGQDRPVQNPQEALERGAGTYKDEVQDMGLDKTLPILPAAPAPSPFRITGGAPGK